jgi:hypothetical protein
LDSETGEGTEGESTGGGGGDEAMPPPAAMGSEGGTTQPQQTEAPAEAPQIEGRRTQLRIVRENIEYLSRDIGNFRRSHQGSIKKLEKQVAALRSELSAQTLSRDVGSFRKSHEASSRRMEKQVAALRSELAALKISIAKEAARTRAKQEATLSRIMAKVSKSSKAAKKR